jgi:hypothetical protein
MSDKLDSAEEKPRHIATSLDGGEYVTLFEGLTGHHRGQNKEGVRTSDSRGWEAQADIEGDTVYGAATSGVPSHNENLSLETCRSLVNRLNRDGATWGEPVELPQQTGSGVDAEAVNTRDPAHRLRMQVVRAEVDGELWKRLDQKREVALDPRTVQEGARRVWDAIEHKRLYADPNVTLVLNSIRTPWLAMWRVIGAFRQRYASDARAVGFQAVWIVGPGKGFVERLDA